MGSGERFATTILDPKRVPLFVECSGLKEKRWSIPKVPMAKERAPFGFKTLSAREVKSLWPNANPPPGHPLTNANTSRMSESNASRLPKMTTTITGKLPLRSDVIDKD